jgi:hypothetical protein
MLNLEESTMRLTGALFLLAILCSVAPAAEVIVSGTSGTDIILLRFEESGNQLKLKAMTSFPAFGPVGVTSLWTPRPTALAAQTTDEEMKVFYTFGDRNQKRLGRSDVIWNQGGGTPVFTSRRYSQELGSFTSFGVFESDTLLAVKFFATKKISPEDPFVFPLNLSGNAPGPGKKLLDNPTGTTLIDTSISDDGEFGMASTYQSSRGNFLVEFAIEGPIVKDKLWFTVQSPLVNVSVSDKTSSGNRLVVYRDVTTVGNRYQTTVTERPFHSVTGQPLPARKLAGPTPLSGGAGAYDYDSLYYNTSDISPDGKWVWYTLPGPGCPLGWESWARKLNPNGAFGGPPFRPLGVCNAKLSRGAGPVVFRSVDIKTVAANPSVGGD